MFIILNRPSQILFRHINIFIKLGMDSLLFTFNKKQLSQDITPIKNAENNKPTGFLLSYQ